MDYEGDCPFGIQKYVFLGFEVYICFGAIPLLLLFTKCLALSRTPLCH
jgi:hypothetical protein